MGYGAERERVEDFRYVRSKRKMKSSPAFQIFLRLKSHFDLAKNMYKHN